MRFSAKQASSATPDAALPPGVPERRARRRKKGPRRRPARYRHRNVYMMDVVREFRERKFEFGYADLLDYVHMNDRTHRLVADLLYEFLAKNRLIKRAR